MSIEIARACVQDPNPETRILAARILEGCVGHETDALLVQLMADESETVAEAAFLILRVKHPWLELEPFQVREPPHSVVKTPLGEVWSGLIQLLEQSLSEVDLKQLKTVLKRWFKLPGVGPDIYEILQRSGKDSLAEWFTVESGIYGNGHDISTQLLVSPTYRCNITCSYCYSKDWDKLHGGDLSTDNLTTLLDWAQKQGINELLLAGGEPTVYKHYEQLLRSARERNILIRLTSNGVYNKATRDLTTAPWIIELTGHYDQEIMAQRPDLANHFRTNMQAAKDSGVDVLLRYTILENSDSAEWQKLIDLALEIGVERINFGFSFLNSLGNNSESYYRFEAGKINHHFEKQFMGFIDDCERHGLLVSQSKPLPLCSISEDSLRRIINSGILRTSCPAHRRHYTQNLTVNPDLTTLPCNAIGVPGSRITEFEDLKSAGEYHSKLLNHLQYIPFGSACESCLFFYRGICQGVCLAQHYATSQSQQAPSSAITIHQEFSNSGNLADKPETGIV
jgi:radical SAM protein with 4Fe4S-binding SPASM domain